ncbi:hypothetical protein IEQ34_002455 [Dendrobium chrysotoxum]|uniref:Uncharacterized protein n=1 Tax=Dendrobium chrysotoxum TaxID=161865 RepID=A0AAV7HNI1_DENCH|nr:hypothetical protein IEQ34_002455 [Dendrobium chrysotoxum]
MREKRQLLKLFSGVESEYPSSLAPCKQPTWIFHPDLLNPSRSFKSYSDLQNHERGVEDSEFQAMETSLSMSLWPDSTSTAKRFIETDIDTSLHL